jgi:hypothetical protein
LRIVILSFVDFINSELILIRTKNYLSVLSSEM